MEIPRTTRRADVDGRRRAMVLAPRSRKEQRGECLNIRLSVAARTPAASSAVRSAASARFFIASRTASVASRSPAAAAAWRSAADARRATVDASSERSRARASASTNRVSSSTAAARAARTSSEDASSFEDCACGHRARSARRRSFRLVFAPLECWRHPFQACDNGRTRGHREANVHSAARRERGGGLVRPKFGRRELGLGAAPLRLRRGRELARFPRSGGLRVRDRRPRLRVAFLRRRKLGEARFR